MNKVHVVCLTESERTELQTRIARGHAGARELMHARILLKVDTGPSGPHLTDTEVAATVEVNARTVARTRQRYATHGLSTAVERQRPRVTPPPKVDGRVEAELLLLACSPAPEGQARWTLRLLAERLVTLEVVDTISHETVRHALKKTNSSPG